jgi:subfamily B ATP-binding cassette protein MsbA
MAVFVVVLFLLKGIFAFWQGYLMSDVGQLVIRDMRNSLYHKFQALSLDYFTKKRSGELISHVTNDVRMVENAVSYGLTDLIYQTLQIVLFSFLVFFIHWRLALVSLILLPLVSIPIIKMGRVLRRLSKSSQEKMADINTQLYETVAGVRIIKGFSLEDYKIKEFECQNKDFYKISMKSIKRTLILAPLTEFMGTLCGVGVFFLAGREVIGGKLSFGVFGLFLGALLSLIRPFKKLSQVNSINQQALAASIRIYEVLDQRPTLTEKPYAVTLPIIKEKINFEDIRFSYDKQEILKGINLEAKKGEVVAIVGPSGVGKTTLIDLISRFYDPQSGRILIDGIDIRDVKIKSLRDQIALVTQETILFNDTVKANIGYGRLDAQDAEIIEAAKKAYAHNFIMNLPGGYYTIIGDRGIRLSGGERQRIAIARAILKNSSILILDEATSQLDSESEQLLQKALDELIQGRTVFVIAHRLSTIKNADKIIVLDGGRIVQEGIHRELLEKAGLYSKLYGAQS